MSDACTLWRDLPAAHRNVLRALDVRLTTRALAELMDVPHSRMAAFLYRLHTDGLIGRLCVHTTTGDQRWWRTELGDRAVATAPVVLLPHYGTVNSSDRVVA